MRPGYRLRETVRVRVGGVACLARWYSTTWLMCSQVPLGAWEYSGQSQTILPLGLVTVKKTPGSSTWVTR